jgi:hypothetical protein
LNEKPLLNNDFDEITLFEEVIIWGIVAKNWNNKLKIDDKMDISI